MDMNTIIGLAGAFGLGSVVTASANYWFNIRREERARRFEEKRVAYVGLMEAYHMAAVEPSDKNAKAYGYWQIRVELVGSPEATYYAQKVAEASPYSEERNTTMNKLLNHMRKDLGVEKSAIVK